MFFFNSYEGYIKKILPLNSKIIISGKVVYYKNKYQITNPTYISSDKKGIRKIDSKYSLTEGLTEKIYRKLIEQVLDKISDIQEWHNKDVLK